MRLTTVSERTGDDVLEFLRVQCLDFDEGAFSPKCITKVSSLFAALISVLKTVWKAGRFAMKEAQKSWRMGNRLTKSTSLRSTNDARGSPPLPAPPLAFHFHFHFHFQIQNKQSN